MILTIPQYRGAAHSTMNRISTAQSFSQASFHISRLQQRSSALSEQIASGMRVQRASDDPLASALGEQAYTRMRREESTQRALSNGRAALQDVDGVLNTATETINQARERIIQAANEPLTDADRQILARDIDSLREQMITWSNARNSNGSAMFGGLMGGSGEDFTQSMTPTGRKVDFSGVVGQYAPTPTSLPTSLDGSQVFSAPDGTNIFDTLEAAKVALETGGGNPHAALRTALGQLDGQLDSLVTARGRVGSYLQREESASQWSRDIQSSAKNRYSDLVETDMPQAIMELQKNNVVQQAALQTYAQVQKMSLFNYL